ncbi:hypothetical protein D187_002094 [Cystobacter fuscus DSM 2262]|uniref:YcaO domain-containing protein n=1 Tax=Cystobacter fuscus (strain ATCC 25194 / DSM 2262 / NBRC 100088 / M29) TaxID=1242864 RepID=S9QTM4_CYSF2|nr:TOMM precursor leader peptide-binding protein [Cystobacter fuscus]EPX60008.1 hypothetical protein D187_002094 [Cystobacter fuscus DSM 2262]
MAVPRIPVFSRHLQVESIESVGVFLITDEDVVWLGGELYQALVPLADGQRSPEDIVAVLEPRYTAAKVYYALERLTRKGWLVEAAPGIPPEDVEYWNGLGVDAASGARALASSRVSLVRSGNATLDTVLEEALEAAGIPLVEHGGGLTLVVTDDYLNPSLAALNQQALRSGGPWVLARLTGKVAWLGPCFVPGKTACWECLAQRLRTNRLVLKFIEERRGQGFLSQPGRGSSESSLRAAASLLAMAMVRGLVTEKSGLEDVLVTLDTRALQTEHHAVVRRPQCPACGNPRLMEERQLRPFQLESQRKRFTQDGGHRLISPEETLRLHQHHVSRLTGVVQQLKPIHTGEGELAPIIDSGPNFARRSQELELLKQTLRNRSTGKGKTWAQARASGLCEAIERYCGVFQGDEARHWDTFQGLGEEALHPQPLLGFSERQYRLREQWNATSASRIHQVPHPFDEGQRVEWSPVWSLTQRRRRYVPTAYCYYGYSDGAPAFCWADSNGCAAGNSLEEAILQGFLELAERDGVALWWYNRVRRPLVRLEDFDEPYFHELARSYQRMGREFWVLDLTTDLGIPTFAALSRDMTRAPERISMGFGAHLEARLGILRALTEMNQFLPLLELSAAGASPGESEFTRWLETATLAQHPYLAPSEGALADTAAYRAQPGSEDLREDVEHCVERARRLGLETLVLDQTRPDVGLSVVRVIVPGLRHMWPRLGPGRLHDVPVRLGWLSQPTPEEQLNPVGIFI